ncbi:SHIRT domain-containing protein [Arcanobacterium hippocoleae]|uniref:SHIRT domain-containing protein n=1 Tax=Arcanobacterium hippocoleae TaxID=149017 RepID=UPI003341482E
MEITKYSPESPLTSFNLANLSGLKNITLVAKPKNQTDDNKNIDAVSKFTAKEYTQDMLLHMPQGVAFIPQEKAVKAANEQQIIATSGSVSGTIAHTSIGPFSPSDTISLRESNAINIKFVPAMVNFIDNGAKLGGTDASLGYAKFALNGKLADDVFNTGTAPAPLTDANGTKTTAGDSMHAWVVGENYSVNGTSRTFAGWNTKADGTGTMVDANTKLTKDLFNAAEADVEDLKLYAIWQGNVKYKFAADPKLTDAPALPQSVMQKLPAQGTAIIGAEVTPGVVNSDPIVDNVNRGKWIFKGWTPATATLPFSGELTFTGYWTFTKNPVAPVNYKFAVNPKTTNSPTLPDFLKKYLPPSTSTEIGTQVTPTPINPGTQEDSANGGKWTLTDGTLPQQQK